MREIYKTLHSVKTTAEGSLDDSFHGLRCFAFSEEHRTICVADVHNKMIQTLTTEGLFLHRWKTVINNSSLCPLSVRRLDEGRVVAITEGWAVVWEHPDLAEYKILEEPKLQFKFGNDVFGFPRDVAVNKRGNFVVSDVGKQRITIHDNEGRFIRSIGKLGHGLGEFSWPYYLCTDNHGRILVSDSHNNSIKVLDDECQSVITEYGKDHLHCGTGMSYCEKTDSLYIGDYDQKKIFQFSSDGKLMSLVSDKEHGCGMPADLHVTDKQDLIVSEFECLKFYKNTTTT